MMHDSSSDDDDSSSGDDDSSSSDDDSSSGGIIRPNPNLSSTPPPPAPACARFSFSFLVLRPLRLSHSPPICTTSWVRVWFRSAPLQSRCGSGSLSAFSGALARRSRLVVSVCEEEERFGSFRALVDLRLVSASSFCGRFVCLTLLRYARRPGLGFGSGVLRCRADAAPISSGRLCLRGGGKVWLLQGFGGSPPRFQEVNRLGMVSPSSRRCRQALGASLLSCCVRRWVSLPRWRVVCLSTKVVVLEFSLARVGCVSSLTGGRLCRFSDRLRLAAPISVCRFSATKSLVVALVSFAAALLHLVFVHIPASLRYYEVFGELFSDGSLSLRADSSGRPKLPGSDSRLNLAHLFAGSSRYYEVFGELFSDGSLSLRADSSGRPKLPGSDSRLNLAHLFAGSSRLT
ncbi:hypothetical protein F2Q69_00028108 [Brassica cretica]|uniref:Uncharacterized protein n=1 Tax=Brassica cretica TaxID=69181 RepID=A0A8S9S4K5_BRACR|nr:hypothetical protein F2Q69_00028108 [Brassica cretica]